MKKALAVAAGYLFLLAASAVTAHAALTVEVPEVDSSSIGTALALVAGSFLVIVSGFRRK